MKKVLIFIFAITALNTTFSQDLIIKKSGDEIKSKVVELTSNEVKYKKFDNLNGPIFTLLKSEVFIIKYENGTKDIFSEESPKTDAIITNNSTTSKTTNSSSTDDLFMKGKMDAQKHYDGYKGAGTGTFVTTLIVSPLVGLIPAVACSSTPPKDINLNYPSSELMKNTDYYNGYTQKAKKIKQGKVWFNWGLAFGIELVAIIILSSK
jgi:hypothetical protein